MPEVPNCEEGIVSTSCDTDVGGCLLIGTDRARDTQPENTLWVGTGGAVHLAATRADGPNGGPDRVPGNPTSQIKRPKADVPLIRTKLNGTQRGGAYEPTCQSRGNGPN